MPQKSTHNDTKFPYTLEQYLRKVNFEMWEKAIDLLKKEIDDDPENEHLWGKELYIKYIQMIEIFFINIFAIRENDLTNNLFIRNEALRTKIDEYFDYYLRNYNRHNEKEAEKFQKQVKENQNKEKWEAFFRGWVFFPNTNSQDSIRKYLNTIQYILDDYIKRKDYELLNAYKHGYRLQIKGKTSWRIGTENSASYLFTNNCSITYYNKERGNTYYEITKTFNWERGYILAHVMINILKNVKRNILNSSSNAREVMCKVSYIDLANILSYDFIQPLFEDNSSNSRFEYELL